MTADAHGLALRYGVDRASLLRIGEQLRHDAALLVEHARGTCGCARGECARAVTALELDVDRLGARIDELANTNA
jgi:hypothetical protein